ncbi:heavy metal sensor histidine kinase [Solimicrobium silvestre]|uniref:Sensor protein n=1 Tax=Solimicrobium silvestre TaxID=2099400 RepID=A0A2S9H260_9BURK|nr:heavy metal sensor histidine kinase [Solimicrobium silvestre]PRC94075.1 Heavy metal sensor kinase [Solimicrobium silvestre]
MKNQRHSLLTRLALLFAALSFVLLATIGYTLYAALVAQLVKRDDAALVTRVDQIRTLLRDEDILNLIKEKPELFANMLGNREALLILKFPGQQPLIEVNPGHIAVPEIPPMPVGTVLDLSSVRHSVENGTPFIVVSTTVQIIDQHRNVHDLQITSGRLLTERTHMLMTYRQQIVEVALIAALLTAALAYWIAYHSLIPIRWLAAQTGAIGIGNLSTRIDSSMAPRELLPLIEGFNAMLNRLETSFAQLSQVSADMAHDLRTPIGNLMGQTEVALSQKRSTEYYEKLLGSNFEELQRVSKMTDNMLFLARAEHADHAIERKQLDVANELERMVDYFEGLADERNLKLEWHGAGLVWADANLLRRALANLLSNAVRYADEGTTISLLVKQEPAGTSMIVENSGPTIEAHHIARLFDRFYRADASRRGSSDASGLGLSIVRSIMLLHQGTWDVTSSAGISCFTLFFPKQSNQYR